MAGENEGGLETVIDSVISQGELDGGSDASSTSQTSTTSTPSQDTGGQSNNSGGGAPNTSAQQSTQQTKPQGQGAGGAAGSGGGQQQTGQAQQPNTQGQQQRPRQGSFAPDAQGNIIDHNGQIVARSGGERRLWEAKHRLENVVVPQLSQRVQQLTNELTEARASTQLARQHNISDREGAVAIQLMASWKKDPLATVKYLLTEVQKAGHDVSGLLSGESGQQIGMGAIARLIDEKLRPITDAQSQSQQQSQQQAAVAAQVDKFFGTYPDAVIHEAPIARLLAQFPDMSPDAAYWRLKAYVQQHGLDWNQPLQPQIEARSNANQTQQQQQQPNPQTQQQQQRPMPNGTNGGAALTTPQTHPVSDANASMADIVKQAMQAEGYKV